MYHVYVNGTRITFRPTTWDRAQAIAYGGYGYQGNARVRFDFS